MRSRTPSRGMTWPASRTNWATCYSRWCSTPVWPRNRRLLDFAAVAEAINDKMVRRHPHVFGDVVSSRRRRAEGGVGGDQGRCERAAKAAGRCNGLTDDVPIALPALTRAVKLSSRVARVGFVWPSAKEVLAGQAA